MRWLRVPGAEDDKRSMGVLGMVTGSTRYPGAAVLGVEAAWRTGIGIVRLWAPPRVQDLVLARRPETMCHALDEEPVDVDAWVLGSGQDARERDSVLRARLLAALRSGAPCVVDAGALDLVAGHAGAAAVTPHARELTRLLGQLGLPAVGDERMRAASAAAALDAVVVAKGAATHVVDPSGAAVAIEAPTHRLATAGTGDVLAGMLGAIVAAHALAAAEPGQLRSMAAEAVALHGAAAAAAAGGRPITALDVAEHVPDAIALELSR